MESREVKRRGGGSGSAQVSSRLAKGLLQVFMPLGHPDGPESDRGMLEEPLPGWHR